MPYTPIEIDRKNHTIMGVNFIITIEHLGILAKEAAYGKSFNTDAERVTHLFGLYQYNIKENP